MVLELQLEYNLYFSRNKKTVFPPNFVKNVFHDKHSNAHVLSTISYFFRAGVLDRGRMCYTVDKS